MSRIADVLAELSSLGAVGAPPKPKEAVAPAPVRVPAPAREPAREPAPEEEPVEVQDVDGAIAALTEGFREGLDTEPVAEDEALEEEEPAPTAAVDEEEEEDEAAGPSIEERLDVALQEVEAISEVVEGLRQSLLAIKAELAE
jgi:hypothetical protein